ncbi:MAG: S8 family serine peptidase, partial [Phycisphaerales bacterium]
MSGVGDAAVVLEVSQLSVPSGLSIVNDVPEAGFIALSDGVFVFNALVSGASAGTFVIETEVSPSDGEAASNTLPVEVLPLAGIPELSPLAVEPAAVNPETPTLVTFSVALSGTSAAPPEFTLARTLEDGTPIAFPATLRDDGVTPDLAAGDGIYTGQVSVNADPTEDSRFYKAIEMAPLAGGMLETPIYELNVTPYPVGPAPSDPGAVVDGPGGTPVYSNEIIISFAPGTSDARIAEIVDSIDGTIVGSVPATGAYQVSFPGDGTFAGVQAVIAQMKTVVDVDIVEPLFPITTTELVPNDPLWPTQAGLAIARAAEAWTVANGEVVIAIVDTGVDATHPDFQRPTGGSKVLVLLGSDVLDGDDDPGDADGHGTRMAGIAAAIGNNGLGIAGDAWRSPILAVRAFGEGASDVTLAQGIVFAAANGARVISVSGGLDTPTVVLEDAIAYARDRGCLIVASAGSQVDGANVTNYPCAFAGVFCVGAVDDEGQPLAGANISLSIDLVAPGENVPTTSAGGGYTTTSGSSPAAAMVAGAAAVAWSIDPTLPAATIEERLIAGAAPLPPSLLDPAIGRLDVFESTFDGSFELPGLGTWVTEGTVSVLESLGRLVPTDRMRMAYVSTGPAGAGVAASLRKEFTVQPGVSMFAITFDYDFVTEEWPEYVGTQYNDSLRIVLVEPDGVEVLLAVETINDSIFYPIEGIDFPGGDDTVGHTGWKTVTAVVPITKGPGSYTVRIEDAGDDVYDSVALVDRIRLIGDPQALYCGAPQAGDCCEEHPTPFCADGACCNTVCLVDPTCCQTAWDAGCATLASELCDSCTPVQEICDNGIDDDGDGLIDCDDPDCAAFPGCTKSGFCGDPQSGDCCEENGTPFCSDAVCCEAVCAADAFCCATEWDQICAERAATICDACAPPAELCDNGIDDDGDDLVDCDDPDCAADPNCPACPDGLSDCQ